MARLHAARLLMALVVTGSAARPSATRSSLDKWMRTNSGTAHERSAAEPEKQADAEQSAPAPRSKAAALTTVLNGIGPDVKRLFASVALFMPSAPVYIACTTEMVEPLGELLNEQDLTTVPILDAYKGMDRHSLAEAGMWVSFNMKRIDILRRAIEEGHDGAWYMDGDTFLLAPLPVINAQVGLSRHRIDPGFEKTFGAWNSGYSFFRSLEALKTWERASQALDQDSAIHQMTLVAVAQNHSKEMVELGCGINVGGFRMDPLLSVDFKPHYDGVHCKDGSVMYQDCAIISGHWHVADTNGRLVRPFMEQALRECRHPLLDAWLASYDA